MLVPFIIVAVIAAGLLVLLVLARQRGDRFRTERDETAEKLTAAEGQVADLTGTVESLNTKIEGLEGDVGNLDTKIDDLSGQNVRLTGEVAGLTGKLEESAETLRKRTELADAQAEQIDVLSGTRDELQAKLTAAEERIVTLAARPGVVVGQSGDRGEDGAVVDDPAASTLWGLEVARSERAWRNSVAIDPTSEAGPFDDTDDPLRTAVEIEAAALREDVGALITIDWKAGPVEAPGQRILVVRVAQELLAQASRAPGAARLVVADGDDGSVVFTFESDDDNVVNLIPPTIDTDLIDIGRDRGVTVTVLAE